MGEFIHTGRAKAEEAAKPAPVCTHGHLKLIWDFPDTGSLRTLPVHRDLIVGETADTHTQKLVNPNKEP